MEKDDLTTLLVAAAGGLGAIMLFVGAMESVVDEGAGRPLLYVGLLLLLASLAAELALVIPFLLRGCRGRGSGNA